MVENFMFICPYCGTKNFPSKSTLLYRKPCVIVCGACKQAWKVNFDKTEADDA